MPADDRNTPRPWRAALVAPVALVTLIAAASALWLATAPSAWAGPAAPLPVQVAAG